MTDHERESGFTRGDLARATGCNIETIRYYEKTGVLPDPPRTDAGYRIYSTAHATRLRFILRARELGFSMEDIRGLMGLEDGAAPTCAEPLLFSSSCMTVMYASTKYEISTLATMNVVNK